VLRVPLARGERAWFKVCAPVQAFEPRLSVELFSRWPDRVAEVIAHDPSRSWLLLADAGTMLGNLGNPPEAWLTVLPAYAELQIGEAAHTADHLAHDVPDLRLSTLPDHFDDLLGTDLPLRRAELDELRRLGPRFAARCMALAEAGIPDSIQHDDLHITNVYERSGHLRVLDWGDSSISHPFASLGETFRFLEERNGLAPNDPWFDRLRDAYLEPWGRGLATAFAPALEVGAMAHAIAWLRQRAPLRPADRAEFDGMLAVVLRRAMELLSGSRG
jgi:hypothetical protein